MYGWSEFLKEMKGYYQVMCSSTHAVFLMSQANHMHAQTTAPVTKTRSVSLALSDARHHFAVPLRATSCLAQYAHNCPASASVQVDLDCLSEAYRTEQREYYLNTSAWAEVHPAQLLGPGTLIKSYDLNKVTLDELKV